ncbi:MarR family transcriptional regulator [Cognatishimia sp. SS12]|uniref:MarR family winged helix-turn-helix transcriptional regulator n=1 Tax=Cognatishimia sp. SS12 TaxID=2979465 RepID=UPI00232BABA3|nr:MarR family transcriptional regulator [Cognatishimia sp. SS12]MDC0739291.1 MarR family transcriptional regulator [Cognatishimia sp. SS12]
MLAREDQSLIALRRILRATEVFGRDFAQASGMTAVQYRVLRTVSESGHATGKEIAVTLRVSQAAVTTIIDRLALKGLVRREKSSSDKRRTNIMITECGAQVLAETPDPLHQKFARKFAALQDWEQAMLLASLERVADMLDYDDLDIDPLFDPDELH